ncbi:hypothetical protein [Nocardia asteroides]|uniref:hypothetical protein n=1 Tax=Nocardia asteroides TaxID=1824 RepID=UPI001E56D797|nr:hypothetical protein [Nocardia asteroides]UGT63083.1 hypothetical protein LTT61_07080 [Nocardia asteroides]
MSTPVTLEIPTASREVVTPEKLAPDDRAAFEQGKSVRSLVIIRFVAGLVGVLLPLALIGVDFVFLGESCVRVRGSLSAYYHSGARDIFVLGLGIVGFLLAAYKITRATLGNVFSLTAGLAIIGVATLPTGRPGPVPAGECGSGGAEAALTPLQQRFEEDVVATWHGCCAVIAFLAFAAICFYTAFRDRKYPMLRPAQVRARPRWRRLEGVFAALDNRIGWQFHLVCGVLILAAIGFFAITAVAGIDELPGGFGPTWVVEVAGITIFSASWFAKGLDDYFWRREPISPCVTRTVEEAVVATAAR